MFYAFELFSGQAKKEKFFARPAKNPNTGFTGMKKKRLGLRGFAA
jgi:hypothetical protein